MLILRGIVDQTGKTPDPDFSPVIDVDTLQLQLSHVVVTFKPSVSPHTAQSFKGT